MSDLALDLVNEVRLSKIEAWLQSVGRVRMNRR